MRVTTNWSAFDSRSTSARKGTNPFPKALFLTGKQALENEKALERSREIVRKELEAYRAAQAAKGIVVK